MEILGPCCAVAFLFLSESAGVEQRKNSRSGKRPGLKRLTARGKDAMSSTILVAFRIARISGDRKSHGKEKLSEHAEITAFFFLRFKRGFGSRREVSPYQAYLIL